MTEPLTPEAEAALREAAAEADIYRPADQVRRLLATLDALRASLDSERPEAIEAWAAALAAAEIGCIGFGGIHDGNDADTHHRRDAAALLRAKAERP